MGLTVLLDVQQDEYLCPGAESIGFKVSEELTHSSTGGIYILLSK